MISSNLICRNQMSVLVFRSVTTSKYAKRMVRKTTQKSQISKKMTNNFYTHLANHITIKTPIQPQFARCARALNPINTAQIPDSCKKLIAVILEKLVTTKHFISTVGECKQEYPFFSSTTVEDDKTSFQRFDIDSTRLDVFFMTYLQDNVRFKSLKKQ